MLNNTEKVSFIIVHDYAECPGECQPGEQTVACILIWRKRQYWIPWGPTHLILADWLCRHRFIAHDAQRIADQLQLDPFVLQHGTGSHLARPNRQT